MWSQCAEGRRGQRSDVFAEAWPARLALRRSRSAVEHLAPVPCAAHFSAVGSVTRCPSPHRTHRVSWAFSCARFCSGAAVTSLRRPLVPAPVSGPCLPALVLVLLVSAGTVAHTFYRPFVHPFAA
jgi:hypothetical protein